MFGTLKKKVLEKGYGFITTDNGDDIFFHFSSIKVDEKDFKKRKEIQNKIFSDLTEGQKLEFDVGTSDKDGGKQTVNVVVIED